MYNGYTLYQAERVRTTRQQREEDNRAGQLAAGSGRLWHSLVVLRGTRQLRSAPSAETIPASALCCPTTGPHAICG